MKILQEKDATKDTIIYYLEEDIKRCEWNTRTCVFKFYETTFGKPTVLKAESETYANRLSQMFLTPDQYKKQERSEQLKRDEEVKSTKPWFLQ